MVYFTYILKSSVDGTYYYGHTNSIQSRLDQHNKGRVPSTKHKRPWEIHYFEEFPTRSDAYKREMFFKSIEGYKFLKEHQIT